MDQSDVRLAFFDLDETITDRDTDMLWAIWRVKKNPFMGIGEILHLIFLNRAYRRGRLTGARYMRYQRFRTLFLSPERYSKLAEKFFVEFGILHIWNEAAKIIEEYGKRGVPTVMITAQNSIIAGYFARHLGMTAVIGNSFLQEGVRFTRAVEPYSFREGKYSGPKIMRTDTASLFQNARFIPTASTMFRFSKWWAHRPSSIPTGSSKRKPVGKDGIS